MSGRSKPVDFPLRYDLADTLTECLTHDMSGASHGQTGADPKATFADTVRTWASHQRKEAASG